MHCLLLFPFFLKYLTNAEYMNSSWPVTLKSTLLFPTSAYGINSGSRILDKILYIFDKVICLCFITVLINTCNDWLLPLLRQFLILNGINKFDVRKSVHHHTIQTIQPTRCNSFTSLLFDIYVWLNMFWVSPRPSSGAYNCTRSLWFYRRREAAGAIPRAHTLC
jgi:hypothetical protein